MTVQRIIAWLAQLQPILVKKMEGNSNSVKWKEIAISKINIKVEGNSNFKIAISFHSSIFGKKWNGMEGNSNAVKNQYILWGSKVVSRLIKDKKQTFVFQA